MSAIRSYLFSGCLLLFASGNWRCSSSAEKSAAQQAVLEKPADAADSSKSGQGGSTGAPASLSDPIFKDGTVYRNSGKERKAVRLEDGSDLVLSVGTTVSLSNAYNKQNRECLVNGEVFFQVADEGGKPFIVHTRNLEIFVLGTKFRVDAFADNAGEEVDLLEGKVRVQKSYHSTTDNEPEILNAGEMVMINRDIDLMEKEKLDSAELKKLHGGY
jgi:ferric-dicitrate binding protein FerR (iron transport regulator)